MGSKIPGRIIYIAVCLLLASLVVFGWTLPAAPQPKKPLRQVFADIGQWKGVSDVRLSKDIIQALELDDFLFRNYRISENAVSLYIGYYRTTSKVGASHSPLVCFPGQGWELSVPKSDKIETDTGKLNAETMIVKKGLEQELIFYWFQSFDKTSVGTFQQKVNNLWARLSAKPEDNAFVRVSTLIENGDYDTAYKNIMHFLKEFYPEFLSYIKT